MQGIRVRMLGTFTIELDGQQVDDSSNRSRKVWLLLAYFIYRRSCVLGQEELISLLRGDGDDEGGNPSNALRAILHRARNTLNQLGPTAGHDLIVRRGGSYGWNPECPVHLDVEEFEALCRAAGQESDDEERLTLCRRALELYRGDFLAKLSSEPWVSPLLAYYHNLYLKVVKAALELLQDGANQAEVAKICKAALRVEPYSEELYYNLMRSLLDLGDQQGVIDAYEQMNELFRTNFGIIPAEDVRNLYYEAVSAVNDKAIPFEILLNQLREEGSDPGALICDYVFFKVLYHSTARMMARNGDAVHIGQISITARDGQPLPPRSLERAMDNLQTHIRVNLRRGDAAARCSVSQFVLMLPQANYENSCMVCQRIVKSFARQYPHSPAELHFIVQALSANS